MMLDAKSGYWQIRMEEQSKQKIVLMMFEGLYKFHVMSYGLCNGPATFQRLLQQVLAGTSSFCNVYFDGILIYSNSVEEHVEHLKQVLDRQD